MSPPRRALTFLAAVAIATFVGCSREQAPEAPPPTSASPDTAPPTERVVGPLDQADSAALATMTERIKRYLELHKEIEAACPRCPTRLRPSRSTRTSVSSNNASVWRAHRQSRATCSRRKQRR